MYRTIIIRETLLRESILNRHRQQPAHRNGVLAILLALALVALSVPGYSMIETSRSGEAVKKISLTSAIDNWQALDHRHLILTLSHAGDYLLTLARDCHGLSFADNLSVSTSNNAIYAGFDYVTADNRKCAIRTISKLNNPDQDSP